jgi:hypothetical protein
MKRLLSILLLMLLGTATPAAAQIPPEWQAAAQAVIGELERDTPQAAKPWTGAELTQGWNLARAWRRHSTCRCQGSPGHARSRQLLPGGSRGWGRRCWCTSTWATRSASPCPSRRWIWTWVTT